MDALDGMKHAVRKFVRAIYFGGKMVKRLCANLPTVGTAVPV
jgi:hypothetical protein